MIRLANRLLCLCLAAACPLFGATMRIGIVADGPAPSLASVRSTFENEVTALLAPDNEVQFVSFVANWTAESAHRVVDEALSSPSVDIVITISEIVSNDISLRGDLPKPSFAAFIVDRHLQHLPFTDGASGITNLNYLSYPTNLERDLRVFHSLVPFNHVALLISEPLMHAIPSLQEHNNTSMRYFPIGTEWDLALNELPEQTEAVYLFPLPRLAPKGLRCLINALNERGIPSFALSGRWLVEDGVLATMTPDSPEKRLARRVALNIQRYLMGDPLASMPVEIQTSEQLMINLQTAQKVNAMLSWEILVEAEVVNEQDCCLAPTLDLLDAIDEAICSNPSLEAARKALAVGCQQVRKAMAPLLPQVQVGGLARIIDRDRAILSFGLEPQSAIFGSASASQVIYSNKLWGNRSIEQRRQQARWEAFISAYLDTVLEVTTTYLNALRASTLQNIQLANLRRTRSNLKMARQRVSIGEARSTEVFRWESEVATNRTSAIKAQYQLRSASVALNRLMNRDQAELPCLAPVSPKDNFWVLGGNWFNHNGANSCGLERLSEFAVGEGLYLSPQLRQLESLICAQKEALGVANRAFYTPDVSFAAEIRDRAAEGGAGQQGLFPLNRTNFSVGVSLSYPILTGGSRIADKRQASEELCRLQFELASQQRQLEQAIRIGLNNAAASYAAIELSQQSADAALKNLKLVTDAYAKGTVNIVDLLDAQNQGLVAELIAANAAYDFLIDLVQLQRTVGRFDFLMTEAERTDLFTRLDEYLVE